MPTSVDMMGQVVVSMTFFFLIIFIILAYFLKQIELKQRVKVNQQTYQDLYEPLRQYLGSTDVKHKEFRKPNIDKLVLQIRDYILSVPEARVKNIQSLIAKRDKLVSELYKLGYTGYTKNNPFTGDSPVMLLVTSELLEEKGSWESVSLINKELVIRFDDNSLAPEINSLIKLRLELGEFLRALQKETVTLTVFDSNQVLVDKLSQKLSLRRLITIRNLVRENGVLKGKNFINTQGINSEYTYGAIKVSYE